MKVLICGGRDYIDEFKLGATMDTLTRYQKITLVIEGEARGADTLGRVWGESRGIPVDKYPAQWDKYGRKAGPIRNVQMLEEGKPDLVVAFGGGTGTNHMVSIAKAKGIKVLEVDRT